MLIPLLAGGLILTVRARIDYPRDVATAIASETAAAQPDSTAEPDVPAG